MDTPSHEGQPIDERNCICTCGGKADSDHVLILERVERRRMKRWCHQRAMKLLLWLVSFLHFGFNVAIPILAFQLPQQPPRQQQHLDYASKSSNTNNNIDDDNTISNDGTYNNSGINNIRLNKVFRETHSRRSADALIADGRVKINGEVVHDMGRRVIPYSDVVELDNELYTGWEQRHGILPLGDDATADIVARQRPLQQEEYIKYWKPVGVTSTTDRTVPGNLLEAIEQSTSSTTSLRQDHHHQITQDRPAITQRIFSVGRLDKDSSGLLLLTSDGRLPNAVLRKEYKRPKTYVVTVDKPLHRSHIDKLRNGLVITTDTVRQGRHRAVTAPTLPCQVDAIDDYTLQITLIEGRNRQIRVMLQTVGDYTVRKLHRTSFMGIDLSRLVGPGDWTRLNPMEQQIIDQAIANAVSSPANPRQ